MKPIVSVIIPTYGGDDAVIRAVQSVLNQEYEPFEVIVIDDNDPDSEARAQTEQYMDQFLSDHQVQYIKHEHNKNGSAARNTGFRHSTGEYICLLDDDDLFLPGKIQKQVDFLEGHLEFGACYCWRKQNNQLICGEYEGDLSEQLLDLSFTPTTGSLMIRRECYAALNGFDETYYRHQDFEFLLRFFERFQIGVVREVLLEIVGNEVNNQPRGKKLYQIKKVYFKQFGKDIERIEKRNPGFKKRVYAEHFARTFKDMLRYGNWILAARIYFEYGYKGGFQFWRVFLKCCFGGLQERMERRLNNCRK